MELNPELLETIISYGLNVVGALAILVVGLFVAGRVANLIRKTSDKRELDATLSRFFANIARYVIVVLAAISALGYFGVETTSFAAVLGAAGLAVGLALQGTLGNVAAGVMLIIFRPFKVGDFVSTAGQSGTVYEVSLFAVTLITPDNRVITVPNGAVFGSTIENVSARDTRRVQITVGVDYSADLDRTREILLGVMNAVENRLQDPAPAVVCAGLGASSVDWHCRVWVPSSEFWPTTDKATVAIKKALDEAQIGIPFPQMDVHLDKVANN
ncbi:MAG: mechanosensitive ion channel domain-containing protein [Myxococcota bacterium]